MSQEVEKIDKESPERLEKVAEFDARMTAGLLAFGRDVAIGRHMVMRTGKRTARRRISWPQSRRC